MPSWPPSTTPSVPRKGGAIEDTRGRKCVCNGLVATVGLGQWREGGLEPAILTSGDDLRGVARVLGSGTRYSASDVVTYLIDGTGTAPVQAAP